MLIELPIFSVSRLLLLLTTISASLVAADVTVTPFPEMEEIGNLHPDRSECQTEIEEKYIYRISNCETITCNNKVTADDTDGYNTGCQAGHIDTVLNLNCLDSNACADAEVNNIQDGGMVICQGAASVCSDSSFSPAISNNNETASYTHIYDNINENNNGWNNCENVDFYHGFGPNGTLICGRNSPCDHIRIGVPLTDPDLCIICAYPWSCSMVEDNFGGSAFALDAYQQSTHNEKATTIGKGCGPTDIVRLCDFYRGKTMYLYFDIDGDGQNDCEGPRFFPGMISPLKASFLFLTVIQSLWICRHRILSLVRPKD